jgi:hypothetical protein
MGLFLLILLLWSLDSIQPQTSFQWSSQERYLSYVPPILETSVSETLSMISIKKINVFEDEGLDKLALLEQFKPIIDSVIVIPKGFHAFEIQSVV